MKQAIISLSGKQFNVREGLTFKVDSLSDTSNIKVLAVLNGEQFEFGAPFLDNVKINLIRVEDRLDDKLRVARFRAKSRYRKNKSHRQPISVVKVESIEITK